MDLTRFNTTAAADSAQRFELIDPFNMEVLTDEDGKPIAFHIVGMASTVARNEDARIQREAPKPPESEDGRAAYEEERRAYYAKANARKLAAMITKLEGKWQLGDKTLKAGDVEGLAELIEGQEWLANQLIMRSRDLQHYRPKM